MYHIILSSQQTIFNRLFLQYSYYMGSCIHSIYMWIYKYIHMYYIGLKQIYLVKRLYCRISIYLN